jgi:hypothetical protein
MAKIIAFFLVDCQRPRPSDAPPHGRGIFIMTIDDS